MPACLGPGVDDGARRSSAQNPGQWQPSAAAQPGYGATPPQGAFGQAQPWSQAQPAPVQPQASAPSPFAWPFPFVLPAPPPVRTVDVNALRALAGRVPCAPKEMAPGEWVLFDCALFTPITRAAGLSLAQAQADDARFGLSGLPTGPLPSSVDHRADGTEGPIKNQKAMGVCTAFSLSTAMDHAVRKMQRKDVLSPLHVWSKYAVAQMGAAGDAAVDKAFTLEPVWPYDPAKACKLSKNPLDHCGVAYHVTPGSGAIDPEIQGDQARADAASRYRLASIERLDTPAKPDQVAAVLAGGDDVWTSFNIDTDAWEHRALHGGVIPDYTPNETVGHAVVLAGYRTVDGGKRQFLVHNSWGESWGDRGYGWISEDMVRANMRGAYKVKVVDAAGMPSLPGLPGVTPPATPTIPTPKGDCASGQVHDAVSGRCAAPCASGSAPAAGVCLPTVPGLPSILGPLPAPGSPREAPKASCPQGQAPDMMTSSCMPLCSTGTPSIGG
ncbi:MAG TPA: C1 family peptidase, partial [Byssovorax sp.]